jgi:hypothetical protein
MTDTTEAKLAKFEAALKTAFDAARANERARVDGHIVANAAMIETTKPEDTTRSYEAGDVRYN